ncbi:dienelactone hydrolase family protein [Polaromonas sp. P2-4]|nr:dienelactone hydrolase family protein [Polaromonas sp. P2-4]
MNLLACRRHLPFFFSAMLVVSTGPAFAQEAPAPNLLSNAAGYTAVPLQKEIKDELGALTAMSNTVFKPKGQGPFPAVVLLHTCGGIRPPHIRQHAGELLAAGYAVLILDSHGPRGFDTCRKKPIPFAVGVLDAYAGLAHLAALPMVNKDRIYLAGYSYGGSVAALLASPQSATTFGSPLRFRATVAHYTHCVRPSRARLLLADTDRPVLMLMGQSDTETPPASCFPLIEELRAAGAPVKWHIYPGMTHGWDKQGEASNGYVYDEEAALDATRRMLEFLDDNK